MELFISPNKITLIKLSKFVAIIIEKFSAKIVLPNDGTKLCSNLYELNYISTVSKGQFAVIFILLDFP